MAAQGTKKKITKHEYLQLVGLAALGKRHAAQSTECEKAMCDLLGIAWGDGDTSDIMYADGTVEELLARKKVEIEY